MLIGRHDALCPKMSELGSFLEVEKIEMINRICQVDEEGPEGSLW